MIDRFVVAVDMELKMKVVLLLVFVVAGVMIPRQVAAECCDGIVTDCVRNGVGSCCYNLSNASLTCSCLVLSLSPNYGLDFDDIYECLGPYTYEYCMGY